MTFQASKIPPHSESRFDLPPAFQVSALFSELPFEIRNKIFSMVLPELEILRPNVHGLFEIAKEHDRGKRFRTRETVLAMARVCKQLYNEVIPIYFGRNTFRFFNAYDLYRYLYMIGYWRRRFITSIQFCICGRCRGGCWHMSTRDVFALASDLLVDCVKLKTLHIGICDHMRDVSWALTGDPSNAGQVALVDMIRQLPRLVDVKLRVFRRWDNHPFDLFEREIPPRQRLGGHGLGRRPGARSQNDYLRELEKALQEAMGTSKTESEGHQSLGEVMEEASCKDLYSNSIAE
ncbi:hypothetical protein F5884DRAFT_749729 [Xylogone sp. PMI_703]|nr:hypothetical protein F5884DRAFT_749729 [Xylogone sp. PMI_703]